MTTSLEESARLAGSHVWLERRLFEILGGWVATTPEPEAKLLLDRHSHHHAWRARQWSDRLPVLADVDRAVLEATPDPVLGPAIAMLAVGSDSQPAPDTRTAARLAAVYRFALPRMWASYDRHRSVAGPTADGSTLRTLGIVTADVTADWQEGEALLQNLLVGPEAVATAARTVEELEASLLRA